MGAIERHPLAFAMGAFAYAGCMLSLAMGPELFSGWVGPVVGASGAVLSFTSYGAALWWHSSKAEGRE